MSAVLNRTPMIVAVGILISIGTMLSLFALLALFTVNGSLPESLIRAEVIAVSCVGSVVGSRYAAKRSASRKLVYAVVTSLAVFLLLFAIGRAISGNATAGGITPQLLLSNIGGGAIGGMRLSTPKKAVLHKR
jgi:putative membrane protein (TIGR04086 family)